MEALVYRRNNRFVINKSMIKVDKKKDEICNALYAELHNEFAGASKHPSYCNLTNLEKIEALNEFARSWLSKRGYL